MGLSLSQEGKAEELYEFRKLTSSHDNYDIPEREENRETTDKQYLIAFIVVFLLLFPFVIYTLMYVDLRIITGTDNCGNFCGYKNKKIDKWSCTGQDMTDKKYQLLNGVHVTANGEIVQKRQCVEHCPTGYDVSFYTCVPKRSSEFNGGGRHIDTSTSDTNLSMEAILAVLGDIGRDIKSGWYLIVISLLVSFVLCFLMMSLFRYAVSFVVWFILLGSIGILGILAGLLWFGYFNYSNITENSKGVADGQKGFLFSAILMSIVVACLIIVITCMIKRVQLIIQLFKEASKAIFALPALILVPFYVSLIIVLVFILWITSTVFMFLAGKLTELDPGYLEYKMDGIMSIAIFYALVVYIWVSEFIIGCQYMIISGGVAAWFFTRNKSYLDAPVSTAFRVLCKFHMGTVAIGSLIITIMTVVRMLIKGLINNEKTRWIIDCCLANVEEFLKFLSKNAYIQTAMHGQPFFKSGKRAAKLLINNAANIIAVNSIGDFVLVIAQILLIALCSVCSIMICQSTGLNHSWALSAICVFTAICMVLTYFAIFEATIDSIFICFCEDTSLNDGMARPYFMSKGLMQFIEDSKAIIPAK